MDIFNKIEKMKSVFLMQTGQEATDIYVGSREVATIVIAAAQYGAILNDRSECASESVCGLRMHKTLDDSHLGLGIAI